MWLCLAATRAVLLAAAPFACDLWAGQLAACTCYCACVNERGRVAVGARLRGVASRDSARAASREPPILWRPARQLSRLRLSGQLLMSTWGADELYVTGLPSDITEPELRGLFGAEGTVREIVIVAKKGPSHPGSPISCIVR